MNDAIFFQCASSNSPYLDLMEINLMRNFNYARRHKMDLEFMSSDIDPVCCSKRTVNYNWTRVLEIQYWLKLYEYVFYLDVDTLIVKPEVDLREAFAGRTAAILMCKHPDLYNSGVAFYHRIPGIDELMAAWVERYPMNLAPEERSWDEQNIINFLMADPRFPGLVERMDDKWNSSFRTNESPHPIIKAWHGACDDNGNRDVALVAKWMREAGA
jgi:hypothetical protein